MQSLNGSVITNNRHMIHFQNARGMRKNNIDYLGFAAEPFSQQAILLTPDSPILQYFFTLTIQTLTFGC